MGNFLKIAINSFRESLREPVYFLMLIVGVGLIAHFPSMALFVFSEQIKLVTDSAMATSMLFGLAVAVLCASNTIGRELRQGTILLLFSKPVSRGSFILAKIAGIAAAASYFILLCNIASVISLYVAVDQFRMNMTIYWVFIGTLACAGAIGMAFNYFKGESFAAAASLALGVLLAVFAAGCAIFGEHLEISVLNVVKALILIQFGGIIMSTLAVALATKFEMVGNLLCCTIIFMLGLLSGYLFNQPDAGGITGAISALLYALLPNWQYFWLADALAVNRTIPWEYVGFAALYTLFYLILAAGWTFALFRNQELAAGGVE